MAIGLGSNLCPRLGHLRTAMRQLERWLEDCTCSPVYETEPLYVTEQPRFLNACCIGWTDLAPGEVLDRLQALERAAGRERGVERFGPRELDLDILMYGAELVRTGRLTIPHPRMLERAFVLRPLADIAGDWCHPETGGSIAGIARGLDQSGIRVTNLRLDEGV